MAADPPDPFVRFATVFERAVTTGIDDPNAMLVSSVDGGGRPSSRMILLKSFDDQGFVFYTNLESRKGREILANPHVALNFYWRELREQIGIQGVAEQVTDDEADAYFATRPRGSQLGAWASRQSRPLKSRASLLVEVAKVEAKYLGKIPRPPQWSGFRVVPDTFEFWVAGKFRLHRRTVYERVDGGWKTHRLYP
ncbi:MAG: pyridoxamine 5'-phosphate oxidase [Thermoanaerobaculia bacterium]